MNLRRVHLFSTVIIHYCAWICLLSIGLAFAAPQASAQSAAGPQTIEKLIDQLEDLAVRLVS
jgi:hypothetical protein